MVRRMLLTMTAAALVTMLAAGPGVAVVRPVGSITGADMVGVSTPTMCQVRMSATFANVGRNAAVEFQIHSRISGTTFRIRRSLAIGQTSFAFTVGVCEVGDTFDRLDVLLFQGPKVVDREAVVKTVVCPAR